jgi:uncharacterized membrane protein
MIQLTLAVLAFVGGHFLLSSPPVRGPVVSRVGEPAFSGIYSALMLAAFVWMVRAFRAASFIPLWSVPPDARVVPAILMPFVCLLMVGSLTVRNPTMIMQSIAASGDPAPGLLKVTRYPMLWAFGLWAFGLWAVAHLIVNGEMAAQLCSGALPSRRSAARSPSMPSGARDPAGFVRLAAQTSNIPMAALIAGRTRLHFGDIGWWRLLLAERYRGSEILYS